MAIFKSDGSSYSPGGRSALESFRPDGVDQDLFDKLDQEQIDLGGSFIYYFKSYIDSNFDHVYMEDRNSIVTQEGYEIKATFEPVEPLQNLDVFGIDSPDEMIFNFNLTNFKNIVGELPKLKSLIYCKWDNTWWETIQVTVAQPYNLWRKYRLQIITRKYQRSRTEQQPERRGAIPQKQTKHDRSLNQELTDQKKNFIF